MRSLIKASLRHLLPSFAKKAYRQLFPSPHNLPLYNVGGFGSASKRALVSYITAPFRLSPSDPLNHAFSNIGIARNIVQALNDLGYSVDVIEYTDTRFAPRKKYDLFIAHGGVNYQHMISRLPRDSTKIYFATGLYWQEHNRQEEERFLWLEQRRGVRLPYDRWIEHSEEEALQSSDGVICLGNEVAKQSYKDYAPIFNLNNAAYYDDRYERVKKDFEAGRRKFLFFSGGGNVHKGLDLLLEAFAQCDAEFFICQDICPDFFELYREQLTDLPNIHLVGKVAMRSPQFYDLADQCNFVISATCAEGQPGAEIECMHQGLIPVLGRQANIDLGDYGICLDVSSIESIVEAIQKAFSYPAELCADLSKKTREATVTNFSDSTFLCSMKTALSTIIQTAGSKASIARGK